jgi:hypothetical protein
VLPTSMTRSIAPPLKDSIPNEQSSINNNQ